MTNEECIVMNNSNQLETFLAKLEQEVAVEYYDDLDSQEDLIELWLVDIPYAKLEIDRELNYINIYCIFSYNDYSDSERLVVDFEDIEREVYTFFEQKEFEKFLKKTAYKVSVWDDGCYMCPCEEIFVGYYNVACDINVIKEFVQTAKHFFEELDLGSIKDIICRKLGEVFQNDGFGQSPYLIIPKEEIDYRSRLQNQTTYYVGAEYVLFKNTKSTAAIYKTHYNLFMKAVNEIELFTDVDFEICGDFVQASSCSFTAKIPCVDYASSVNYEVAVANINLSYMKPFLTENNITLLSSVINKDELQKIKDTRKQLLPRIHTEGHTDWKHIQHAYEAIRLANSLDICFEEYLPTVNIGDQTLFNMCKTMSKNQNPSVHIMIFDRDNIALDQIEDGSMGFKDWGGRVYSFAIPLPEHRQNTPKISIEHYYTDSEIKHEIEEGGIMRRLYLGHEFDIHGRAPQIGKICTCYKKCGEQSVAIIDDNVFDNNSCSCVDYALSKMKFTEYIINVEMSNEAVKAFKKLFERISLVLKYDAESKSRSKFKR